MAALAVTSANSNSLFNSRKAVFRNSSGIPYVLAFYGTTIQVSKGNATTPTSWTHYTYSALGAILVSLTGAMDSTNVLHMCWLEDNGASSDLVYRTFNCNTDAWGANTIVNADIGSDPYFSYLFASITVDSADKPHIAYTAYPSISGAATYALWYINKVAVNWSSSVQVQHVKNRNCASPEIVIGSIEPEIEFNNRSGMSGSTRLKAIDLWQTDIPQGNKETLARMLFCVENPPGSKYISGSQDAIGIVYPGVNRLDYAGGAYWPEKITQVTDEETLSFIERHLWFINLSPREGDYDVLSDTRITENGAKALCDAANNTWTAILEKDATMFGKYFRQSFEAQIAMFPKMVNQHIYNTIQIYAGNVLGWKISGAGGGGYLVLVSEKPVENAMRIKIRREY